MNAIYKVAFNKITQSFVAVSELAKSGGKKSNKVNKSKVITSAVVTSGLLLSGATFAANPVNDTYVKVSEACDGNVAGECDLKNNDPDQFKADTAAVIQGAKTVAIGLKTVAKPTGAIAMGYDVQIQHGFELGTGPSGQYADNSIGLGSTIHIQSGNSVGIGRDLELKNSGTNANTVAVGKGITTSSSKSTILGNRITDTEGGNKVVIGSNIAMSKVSDNSVIIGRDFGYLGTGSVDASTLQDTVSIGSEIQITSADASQSVVLGNNIELGGRGAVAIGSDDSGTKYGYDRTKASANAAVAIGAHAQASGVGSSALGAKSHAYAEESISLGVLSEVEKDKKWGIALGRAAKSKVAGGIAIGADSWADRAKNETGYVPTGITGQEATDIANTTKNQVDRGVVSVGQGTWLTRQITGVAAGSQNSDAVNVAQLKAVANLANRDLTFAGDSGTTFTRKLGTTTNVKGGATGALSDNNIGVVANGTDTLTVKLAKTLNGLDAVNSTAVNATNVTATDSVQAPTVKTNKLTTTDGATSVNVSDIATKSELAAAGKEVDVVASATNNVDGALTVTKVNDATANKDTFTVALDKAKLSKAVADNLASNTTAQTAMQDNLKLSYRVNGAADTETDTTKKNKVSLTKGLDFKNGTKTVATIGADGEVKYSLDDETIAKLNSIDTVTYEKADGTEVVKANDGKFYPKDQVNPDGTLKDAATATPLSEDEEKALVAKKGGKAKQMANVASGLGLDNTKTEPATAITADAAQKAIAGDAKDGKGGLLTQTTGLDKVATVGDLQALAQAGLDFTGNNNTVNVHRPLGTKLIVEGEKGAEASENIDGTNTAADNIYVEADDTLNKLIVKLSKVLQGLTSVETVDAEGNKTVQNGSGVTITPKDTTKSPVSLTKDGLNNGGNEIKGLADGTTDDAAVTKGQMDKALADAASNSPTVYKDADGNELVKAVDGLFYPKDQVNPDGTVKTTDASGNPLTATPVTEDKVTVETSGEAKQMGNVKDGLDGKNVSDLVANPDTLTAADKGKVATVGDLQKLAKAGIDFGGDTGTDVHKNLGEKVTVKGGITDTAKLSDNNIGVVADGTNNLTVKLAKELKGLTSVETVNADGSKTVLDGNGVAVKDKDGNDTATLTKDGLKFAGKDGKDGLSVNADGTITGLKDATTDDGAVTKGQMDKALEKAAANSPTVYTDADGNPLVKAENGNFYPKDQVNADGSLKDPASATLVNEGDVVVETSGEAKQMGNVKSGLGDTTVDALNKIDPTTAEGKKALQKVATTGDLQKLSKAGLNFGGDSGDQIHKNLSEKLEIVGGETVADNLTTLLDKNIGVISNKGKLEVRLAKNLDGLESIDFAKDKNGNPVGQITGLAAGKTDDAAANKGQMDTAIWNATKKATTDKDGNEYITGNDGKLYAKADVDPVTGKPLANAQPVDKDSLDLVVNANDGKAQQLGNVASGLGLENTKGDNPTAITADAAKNAIAGKDGKSGLLAQKDPKELNKVATVGDMQALAQAGLDFAGNDEAEVHRPLGTKLTIVGEGVDKTVATSFESAKGNIDVVRNADENGLVVKLSKNLKGITSIAQKEDGTGTKFELTDNGVKISNNGNDTRLTGIAAGKTDSDAVNMKQFRDVVGQNVKPVETDAGKVVVETVKAGETVKVAKRDANGNIVLGANGQPELVEQPVKADKTYTMKTYNPEEGGEYVTNSVVQAIDRMNNGGLKFIHVNSADKDKPDSVQAVNSDDSQANGAHSVAIGKGSKANAENTIAIGTRNIVDAKNSGAIGDPTYIAKVDVENNEVEGSYSLGNSNVINSSHTFVLGSNVNTKLDEQGKPVLKDGKPEAVGNTVANSVYLGNESAATAENTKTTAGKTKVNSANVNGLKYGGFAGSTPVGIVSVGAVGKERRIQNVAAGKISKDSTDAINGSQLYAVSKEMGEINKALKAGIAGSAAMTMLDTPNHPGESTVAAGSAYYKGQGAIAVGLSTRSDNGRWLIRGAISHDTQSGSIVGAGASYTW